MVRVASEAGGARKTECRAPGGQKVLLFPGQCR
jgi:hypothetical protein